MIAAHAVRGAIRRGFAETSETLLYNLCALHPDRGRSPAMQLIGLTVLLVEDDVDNLELLASFLEAEGALVLSAGSIVAALAMSLGKTVDVVVSDLELPDGDGCALLRQLKVRDVRFKMPAIAVTGYSEGKWRHQASACGFERYLVKPFALEALVAAVAELSGSSARASSVREASEPACLEARRAAGDLAGQ